MVSTQAQKTGSTVYYPLHLEKMKIYVCLCVAPQKKGVDLYVQQKVMLPCRKTQTTHRKTPRLCYVLVLSYSLPWTSFILFCTNYCNNMYYYVATIIPGYDSFSLKICFQLSKEFHVTSFKKFAISSSKYALFPTKYNIVCNVACYILFILQISIIKYYYTNIWVSVTYL